MSLYQSLQPCQVYDKMKANNRAGQIRVSHIFKSLPQTVTSHVLRSAEARMDSLYAALQNGQADFDECVRNFSDEKKSFWDKLVTDAC